MLFENILILKFGLLKTLLSDKFKLDLKNYELFKFI
jgi:hypothetical protein